jgi:hypothetical protein
MSRLTVFLARLIGLFIILLVVAMLVRGSAVVQSTVADAPVMLAYAMISLAIGLAMILGHDVWSGGVLPVAVTLVGWLIFAKGLLLLLLPPEALSYMFGQLRYGEHLYLYLAPSLLIGLYLAGAGFAAPLRNGIGASSDLH